MLLGSVVVWLLVDAAAMVWVYAQECWNDSIVDPGAPFSLRDRCT